jgi:hypothetical protein
VCLRVRAIVCERACESVRESVFESAKSESVVPECVRVCLSVRAIVCARVRDRVCVFECV